MAEDGSAAKIVVMVKPTASGGKFQIEVDPEISVLDMKAEVAKTSGMPPASEQRLIYKGQILKDEKKISEDKVRACGPHGGWQVTGCKVRLIPK
eukprot:gene3671-13746_t